MRSSRFGRGHFAPGERQAPHAETVTDTQGPL